MKNILSWIVGAAGAVLGFLFGPLNGVMIAFLALMCIDFITGILSAGFRKTVDSRLCLKGIVKKVGELALVAVAHILDTYVIGVGGALMSVVEFFFIANEGISVIENLGECGVPIPKKLKSVLEQLRDDNDNSEVN